MFERYTEHARRTLFYARYEASQLGSRSIDTEHILLGLIRDGHGFTGDFFARNHVSLDDVRRDVSSGTAPRERVPTSVEIPFSDETKEVLNCSMEEADRLGHGHIGAEHLLLGLLRVDGSVAASILTGRGIDLGSVRVEAAQRWATAGLERSAINEVLARLDVLKELVWKLSEEPAESAESRDMITRAQSEVDAVRDALNKWSAGGGGA